MGGTGFVFENRRRGFSQHGGGQGPEGVCREWGGVNIFFRAETPTKVFCESTRERKTHKHRQIRGSVLVLGGCQKFVTVRFFWDHPLWGRKITSTKSPENPGTILRNLCLFVCVCVCVFLRLFFSLPS